ncbi:MAG: hemolysin III family protein [Salinivirgaceae bacterium]|jgi:hemolysin III|nr:hemolysin III family protein [Salinivirgaceae bacterium]
MTTTAPRFSKQEELANSISHGVGFMLAIAATIIILIYSARYGNTWSIVSNAIFGATMILLYLSSTLNHILNQGKVKNFFHNFDQVAIYFLIAGTYTPLSLMVIRNDWGWAMFGIEWGFALAGLLIKIFAPNNFEKGVHTFTIISYIIMGWLLLFFIKPLVHHLSSTSIVLIIAGGLSYTFGVFFFKLEKLPYSHLIWHIMVMVGTACHWLAMLVFLRQ